MSSIYVVQPNDTPMSIAMKLTGNAARVGELVRANAHKQAVLVNAAPDVVPGGILTFQDLHVGEHLTVPSSWALMHSGVQSGAGVGSHKPSHVRKPMNTHLANRASGVGAGVSGHAYPQRAPHFDVRPRAGADGGGDDSGHGVEPILTISGRHGHPAAQPTEGVGAVGDAGDALFYAKTGKPCCGGCATGGPCEGVGGCATNRCGVAGCVAAECAVQMPPCSGCPKASPSIPGSTSFPVGFGQTAATGASTASTVGDALAGWGVPLAVGAISIVAGFGLAYVISNR